MVPGDGRARDLQPEGPADAHGPLSITVTCDRYGHLFPGWDAEAGAALEAAQGHGAAMESNHPSGGLLRPAGLKTGT
jgi:hypothetical protein